MATLSSLKNPRLITVFLIILTVLLAGIAVFAAYQLQKKENVNPGDSSANTCLICQEAANARATCESYKATNGVSECGWENDIASAESQCSACQAQNNITPTTSNAANTIACGNQYPDSAGSFASLCSGGNPPGTAIVQSFCSACVDGAAPAGATCETKFVRCDFPTTAPTQGGNANLPPECGSPDFAGKVTYLGVGDRLKVINCTDQASSQSCEVLTHTCSSATGDPGVNGQCSSNPTSSSETVTAPANGVGYSNVLTCNPNACGSCQIDINCGGAIGGREGEFFSSGVNCGTGTGGNPTPTPVTPTPTSITPTPTVTTTSTPTTTVTSTPTATPTPTVTSVVGYSVQKSATPSVISASGTVTYTASFKNTGTGSVNVATIEDDYADQFAYQTGSAVFTRPNGTTLSKNPAIQNGKMTWTFTSADNVTLGANQSLLLTYRMTAANASGNYPNTICLVVPNGGCASAAVGIGQQPATGLKSSTIITMIGFGLVALSGSLVLIKKRRSMSW